MSYSMLALAPSPSSARRPSPSVGSTSRDAIVIRKGTGDQRKFILLHDFARTDMAWADTALTGRPIMTLLRGRVIYRDGVVADGIRGRELSFKTSP